MTHSTNRRWRLVLLPLALLSVGAFVTGCPVPDPDPSDGTYDEGFADGFARDDQYWIGFFDSFETLDASFYYQGDTIPAPTSPDYEEGYWDGVWWAYNDGYFTSYRYAFIIGFSEGYDNAFWPDYLDFLESDEHVEYLNGGFGDGYNDGFSEGRIFGAADYEAGLDFDWESALDEYEHGGEDGQGLDLYFEEIDLGTGEFGPVILYEWGTDPATLKKATRKGLEGRSVPAIRKAVDPDDLELYRPIRADAQEKLDIIPAESMRSDRELVVEGTWLDRVTAYLSLTGSKSEKQDSPRARAVSK